MTTQLTLSLTAPPSPLAAGGAIFSDDRRHRYVLRRGDGSCACHGVCFVMLNPSIASEDEDDPTIRKCQGFARRWGYRRIVVVNLFSRVSTDPKDLRRETEEAMGDPDNLDHIAREASGAGVVVVAWGNNPTLLKGTRRDATVAQRLIGDGRRLHAIRTNKGGQPAHPLYLPYELEPVPWDLP